MNKKRSLLCFTALVLMLVLTFSFGAFASEDMPAEVSESAEDASFAMLLNRVWEYVNENAGDLLSATSLGSIIVYMILQKNSKGTFLSGISKLITSQKGVISASEDNKTAVDALSADQKKLMEHFEKYASGEDERTKMTASLIVEVMGLIEIQHVLCLNNSNVPQAVKNLVTSVYARCLSVINDDAEIKDAYQQMRAILGLGEVKIDEEKSN